MLRRLNLAVFLLAFVFASAVRAEEKAAPAEPLKIYVAASTKEAVEAIAKLFTSETGVAVEVSPGPSSKLAKQIVEGAPADLFLSADAANADFLNEKQLVEKRRNLLGNKLVLVVPSDQMPRITSLEELATDRVKELAISLEKVPAGEYAREALRKAGVWEKVEKKVVGAEDVKATLAFVEKGASAGIVYLTDAVGNSKVRLELEVKPSLYTPIQYPLVMVKRGKPNPDAAKFYDFLGSPKATAIFKQKFFQVLP